MYFDNASEKNNYLHAIILWEGQVEITITIIIIWLVFVGNITHALIG